MNIFCDVDETICRTPCIEGVNKYAEATPIQRNIDKINKLYAEGNQITYWTARGSASGVDYSILTANQLQLWGCKFHHLLMGKPSFDILYDDKAFNIDTI